MARVNYTVSKASSTAVISYADAKMHLRLTTDDEQDLVQAFIDAAVEAAENYTGKSINVYSITAVAKTFINDLSLDYGPVKANFKIEYYNTSNTLVELPATNYVVLNDTGAACIAFNDTGSLPVVYDRPDGIKITYEAGQVATAVPVVFAQFIKLCIAFLFENRADTIDKLPRFMYSLIRPYKKWD